MIRYFIFCFSLFSLLGVKLIANEGVKITQNVPANVKQGAEFQIDVVINKKGVEGFAKLQFELPVGLSASSIESRGAAFTFKEQYVNFVWMSLPADESFTISYRVNVSSVVFGTDSITGKFNYILNNEKQTYIVPGAVINILLPNSEISTIANSSNIPTTKTETEKTSNEIIQNQNPDLVTTEKVAETKTNIASEIKSEVKEEVKEPIEKVAESITKTTEKVKPDAKTPAAAIAKISEATSVPGVVFKVQVAALSNTAKEGVFSSLSDVSSYRSPEGLLKYYSGNFSSYEAAVQHLTGVRGKGFETAFIAAFRNGSPISVREALGK